MRRFHFRAVLLTVIGFATISIIASQTDVSGRILYETINETGITLTLIVDTETYQFHIADTQCYGISPELDQVALVDSNNPQAIDVYAISTGERLTRIPWQPEWRSTCWYWWHDQHTLHISDPELYERMLYSVDITTSEVTQHAFPPSIILLNKPPRSGVIYSNSDDLYVYRRCYTASYTHDEKGCQDPGGEWVVYDAMNDEVITVLPDFSWWTVHPKPAEFYGVWSHDDRYLAYHTATSFQIYDRENNSIIIPSSEEDALCRQKGTWRWSPDNREVAFFCSIHVEGTAFTQHLAFLDVPTNTYTLIPASSELFQSIAFNFEWSPDGEGILAMRGDTLIEIDRQGHISEIDRGVERLQVWYASDI